MGIHKPLAITVIGLIGLVSSAIADHLPDKLLAKGKPEKKLASIDMEHATLKDMVRRYGQPKHTSPDEYVWNQRGLNLQVIILHIPEVKGGDYIAMIEVSGRDPQGIGRTGAGLKLGDSRAALKRLYGNKFLESRPPTATTHSITIAWRKEEYSLTAEFNKTGRITKLSLFAPE